MTRVAITGGSGFIGTNLIEHYTARGVPVINLDPVEPRHPEQIQHWRKIDPLDISDVGGVLSEFAPTCVFHLGARTDLRGTTINDYAWNIAGVEVILAACNALASLNRVIFASSRLVCRIGYQPTCDTDYCAPNAYGESKARGEQIIRHGQAAFPWVIVRPTSIWGPWFYIPYRTFFMTIAANRYVHIVGNPIQKSFGYVGNTVHQLATIAESSHGTLDGTTLYLADYPPLDVVDFANRIQREIGSRPIHRAPRAVVRPAALFGDVLQRLGWNEPPLTSFRLANLLTEMVYDTEPLRGLIPKLPYSLDEGIQHTVAWLRDRHFLAPATSASMR